MNIYTDLWFQVVGPMTVKLCCPTAVRTHGTSRVRLDEEGKFCRPHTAAADMQRLLSQTGATPWSNQATTFQQNSNSDVPLETGDEDLEIFLFLSSESSVCRLLSNCPCNSYTVQITNQTALSSILAASHITIIHIVDIQTSLMIFRLSLNDLHQAPCHPMLLIHSLYNIRLVLC